MSINELSTDRELLKDIESILKYHKGEFRTLSVPAQYDLEIIQKGIQDALSPKNANGADGFQAPVKIVKKAKRKAKKKATV